MATSRPILILLLTLNLIGHYCDTIEAIQNDALLRGSNEQSDNEESQAKDIEPEKTLREELSKHVDVTKEDVSVSTTTEASIASSIAEFVEVSLDDETTTDVSISTESSVKTEETTASVLVDKTEPSSSSTTTSTAKAVEEAAESPAVVGGATGVFEEANDFSQRVPKLSDNSEPKQQTSKGSFDVKPLTTQSMSKSSTLKGWLQDSWLRPPPGILVPLRPMALNRALAVWNDLTAEGLNMTDIVVVGYDSNGVNWRSRHSLQPNGNGSGQRTVAEALSKLLLKYQDVTEASPDGTMRALTSAAKLVPYDSALFVVTDKGPGDVQKLPLALRALVEKRLKVYTIWTDPAHPSEESEQQLQSLRNVSQHTEGYVLPYSLQVMDMESAKNPELLLQTWDQRDFPHPRKGRIQTHIEEEKLDTLLVRRGGGEAISLGVPVENGVTALRIYIEGLVEHAVLYPPNDAPQIDLYNESSVLAFSPRSRTDGLSPRDVYLLFPGSDDVKDHSLAVLPVKQAATESQAPTVGVWHLSVRCDTCDYRLCVAATSRIHFQAVIAPKETLKIRVVGPVASVRESVLIDEYGAELSSLPFSYQPIATDGQEPQEGPPTELIADVALPTLKGSRVYAKIVGRDIRGEPFVRLSGPLNQQEVRMGRSAVSFPDGNDLERAEEYNSKVYNERLQYNETSVLPFNRAVSQVVNQRGTLQTAVQIGLSTRIYGAPGDNLQLHFEVTNYREQTVYFRFQAVGELRFLTGINPNAQNIGPGQTANVVVTATITGTAQPGARDLITFTATAVPGVESVSISTYLYVVNQGQSIQDVWSPELRHNFQGSCFGSTGDDCAQHPWSVTVIARDANSGLLRLSSSPIGLVYDSNFIAGSREEVVAVYRATCCAPRVIVTAIDAYGNANSYVIDISNYITGAGIAAIVLGVFLFIALVVLIVFLVYWCVRRRRESKELPYTTSSRNLS